MSTFQAVVNAFLTTYPDCDATTAAQLLNDIDEEILAVIPYRKSTVYLGFQKNMAQYDADESIIKVWEATLLRPDGSRAALAQKSTSELDFSRPGWRGTNSSVPWDFGFDANLTTGRYFVSPAPSWINPVVSGGTGNGVPVVLSFPTPHGIASGTQVVVQNVVGNLAANGLAFASVPDPPGMTLGLFSDSKLTSALIGTGPYTSGGVVGTTSMPLLALDCTQRMTSLTATSNMPLGPQLRRLYADGMRWLWSLQKHLETAATYGQQFERDLALAQDMWARRAADVAIEIKPFTQDMAFRRGRSSRFVGRGVRF